MQCFAETKTGASREARARRERLLHAMAATATVCTVLATGSARADVIAWAEWDIPSATRSLANGVIMGAGATP